MSAKHLAARLIVGAGEMVAVLERTPTLRLSSQLGAPAQQSFELWVGRGPSGAKKHIGSECAGGSELWCWS